MAQENEKDDLDLPFGSYPAMNQGNKKDNTKQIIINENETSLSLACSQGKYYLVKSLLKRGYDINQKDYLNFTPIMRAADNGHINIVKLLISYGAKISYELLSFVKAKIEILEQNASKGKEDPYIVASWKNFLDYLIQEGKKQ